MKPPLTAARAAATPTRGLLALAALASLVVPGGAFAQTETADVEVDPAEVRSHTAAMAAHHLCAGVFVVGRDHVRDPDTVVENDIARFEVFNWQDDFAYAVDADARTASVWGEGVDPRTAEYNGDQGCTILPVGMGDVAFDPTPVARGVPDPESTPWPMGDADSHHDPFPTEVDFDGFQAALDRAMARDEHNTRALLVVYKGKILGERYAEGFGPNTPQISWSEGKSIAAALLGVAIEAGHLDIGLDDPAPVPEWHGEGDPRREIRIRDLLNMSSGLDFQNWGIGEPQDWMSGNEHFRIYFDGLDVYEHAIDQPMDLEPGERFRYRNSDPLAVARIVRQAAEAAGEEWLTYPQRHLFDRIGARSYVLETDAWGNFIITGYDFGSARDWARFGLLHLWDGVWQGERILPEGWVEFVTTPAPGDPDMNYGGLFWLNRGDQLPRAPADTYYAAGFMGQFTAVIPSLDMVVVRLGPSPGDIRGYLSDIIGDVAGTIEPAR